MNNRMRLEMLSRSQNESFARVVVSAFATQLDPTIEELTDIKTAVSEAVTNSIIHGYENASGIINIICRIEDDNFSVEIIDYGIGIDDIEKVREPLYTSKPDMERSGMGFTVMENFMDQIEIYSTPGIETKIIMHKRIGSKNI